MLVGALQPKFQLLLRLRTHFLSLQNPDAQDRIFFDSLVRAVTMQINHVMTKYIAEKTRLHAFMKQYTIFTPN
jgi:hypothetical protein